MRFKIQFEAKLPVTIKKDEEINQFIACCPILDVMSQGPSPAAAKKNLVEALNLFFISCYEHGTLDEVMKECGFAALNKSEATPVESYIDNFIDVQIPFFSPDQTAVECQV